MCIRDSKHTDDGETKIGTPEKGASFEIYLKSAGSYDAANKDERDTCLLYTSRCV